MCCSCCCCWTSYVGWTCAVIVLMHFRTTEWLLARGEEDCRPERLAQCLPKTNSFLDNNQMVFARNEAELNTVCRTLNVEIECVEQYISMCYGPDKKEIYERMKQDSMDIIDNLCTNGTFRHEYLSHAQCFNDSSLSYKRCIRSYRHFMNESLSGMDPLKSNPEDSLVEFCCAYSDFITCINDQVLCYCEPATVTYYQNFMNRSMGPIFQGRCANYTVGSIWCSSATRTRTRALGLILPLVLFTIVTFTR